MIDPVPQHDGSSTPADHPIGDDDSIAALFSRLIDDAERFVRAEVKLYRAQAIARITGARTAILLGATAFLLAQSAIFAMFVGFVLILRRSVGPVWATIIVVGTALLVAAVLVRLAVAKLRQVTQVQDGPS